MSGSNYIERIKQAVGEEYVLTNEDMSRHTTFRIGGPADCFVTPKNEEELRDILKVCSQEGIPYFILGNGSNLLVSDKGYRGVIIQLFRNMAGINVKGETVTAMTGALLTQIAARAASESLTGFEFASGIPGTLGGACVMNAGAYGGEMKDVLVSVRAMDANGAVRTFAKEELDLGYRHSALMDGGYIVLSAELKLRKGDPAEILAVMEDLKCRRTSKQPLDLPSAGSTFKRPEGYFAGKLIQDAGLRGYAVGGAKVSEKHCGFVVNTGGATAEDVSGLIRYIQGKVRDQFGVDMYPEVRFLGDF
ncbi:MAG: UDP-N-acetylmuramate dehydrogenase [Lachnospiraceae bacterium]|nr:UDP-N-acetylmuramate dehydrogenase [Lachnospiraceae bacterium]